jgi:hypothetical protein
VRQDLQDRLLVGNWVEAGLSFDGTPPITPLEYGDALEARLRALPATMTAGEEVQTGASARHAPAVFGAQCTDHETLRDGRAFYQQRAPAADGTAWTTAAMLAAWLAGEEPGVAVVPISRPGRLPAACGAGS